MSFADLINASPHECFALLDDCEASNADARSRLYTKYAGSLFCDRASELNILLEKMQYWLRQGLYAVSLNTYELGAEMHGIRPWQEGSPLSQVLLFEHCEHLSAVETAAWLADREDAAFAGTRCFAERCSGITHIHADVTKDQFFSAISKIRDYLAAGDTYQVNYTYRLRFECYGSLYALYRRLRTRQPVPYGAFIALPDGSAVLSFSPELFVSHEHGRITTRPMKGTAAASGIPDLDAEKSLQLAADPKNRAENLMIVDLLRNDLGQIASVGSVKVPQMFEVNAYRSVLQMTSTVCAELRPAATLGDLFWALYPCGSITGAPKRRTMQIIRELEQSPRGYYTGAIGWFDKSEGQHPIGNFCLSVPIRTLVVNPPGGGGMRHGEMGIGAGIVYDSDAAAEYEECQLKARFLTQMPCEFDLFETMFATRQEGCRHLEVHLQRLDSSARFFGFSFNQTHVRSALENLQKNLLGDTDYRVRLRLKHSGEFAIESAPLALSPTVVKVFLARQRTDPANIFLRHKTSLRAQYDNAWRAAEAEGAFDVLFQNIEGELTEGARSNVFVKLDGQWYTPPLTAGVLPGVMRQILLSDPELRASARRLTLDDLRRADKVMVCNALRGALEAKLEWPERDFPMPAV